MFKKKEVLNQFSSISQEIEYQLDKILTNKKVDLEKSLEDQIQQMREEAEKKIEQNKEEIEEEKKGLKEYTEYVAGLEEKGKELIESINNHLGQVAQNKKDMWELVETMDGELKSMVELEKEYNKIQQDASGRLNAINSQLENKYGIESKIPESSVFKETIEIDFTHETEKLSEIKERLQSLEVSKAGESAEEEEHPHPSNPDT
ncbi:MAG: hypothetical protein PVI11_06065 [Candidatus Aminicenantes bacterium]